MSATAFRWYEQRPWRVDRRLTNIVFIEGMAEPDDSGHRFDDHIVALMPSPELAQMVVDCVNQVWGHV